MAEVVRMPPLSDTMSNGKIVRWYKKRGDKVNADDVLADVETDKAVMELIPYASGTILYLSVERGGRIPVNGIVAIIGKVGEDVRTILDAEKGNVTSSQIQASKVASHLARKNGLDVNSIDGSGEDGRITPRDIKKQISGSKQDLSRVFIVHGRDELSQLIVARFIEKLGFIPIILHEQTSGSKTIIEKIETYSNVGFGIVLYTGCDIGALNGRKPKLQARARQNVIFEHGFLIGKIGRDRVCALVKGEVEIPNDISGVIYVEMDDRKAWQVEIAKEMKSCGYPVNLNNL